jgi:hypothetical protein
MIPREGKIEIVSGDLGGGKSAYGVECAFELLLAGGTVFTNIEMFPDKIAERMREQYRLEFDPSRLIQLQGQSMKDFHKQLKRGADGEVVMALIDEASLDFNARDYRETSDELLNFIVLVRKLDVWLVFVLQDGNDLDKQIRRKVTVEVACRNLKEEQILGMPFPLPVYCRVRYKIMQGRKHHKLGSSEWLLKLPAWGLYNSKALLGAKALEFEKMEVCHRQKLRRVEVKETPWWPAMAAATAATFILCAISS